MTTQPITAAANPGDFAARPDTIRNVFFFFSVLVTTMVAMWPTIGRAQHGWRVADQWSLREGLPQNMVYTVLQSQDGYIWTGTRGGISRFDGVTFTTYDDRKENQLKELEVWALLHARDGSIWGGTFGGGIVHLKDGRFTTYTTEDGLVGNLVTALAEDAQGGIWIGSNRGLSHFKDGKFTNYTSGTATGLERVRTLFVDRDGSLWIGGGRGEIIRYVDGKFSSVTFEGTVPTWEIRAFLRDREGAMWIAAYNGVYRVRDGKSVHYNSSRGLSTDRAFCLLEDSDGNIWVGTDVGLDRYIPPQDVFQNEYRPSHTDAVFAICQDNEGSLWVGHRGSGLVRLHGALFRSYTRNDGLRDESVHVVLTDRNDRVWFGTARGLHYQVDGKIVVLNDRNGLTSRPIEALHQDRAGHLWVGSVVGLYRSSSPIDDPAWSAAPQFVAVPNPELRNMASRAILEDRSGTLWVGTVSNGLVRYQDGEFTTFTTKNGLADDAVRGVCEDRDGSVWIGTRRGLMRYRDGKFTTYTTEDGLAGDFIGSLYMDGENTLWIGSRYGLSRFKDGSFTTYTVKHGLPANYLYSFTEDEHGFMWMTCSKGIFRVAKQQLADFANGRITSVRAEMFGREHGLTSTALPAGYAPSSSCASDGRLWFGMFGGVAMVDPRKIRSNTLPPPVHVSSVIIDKREYPLDRVATAPPGRGDLEFHYTALSFLAPEKMKFKYRLEGYDTDWIDPSNRRAAYYSNIGPGDYTFRVMAANNDGVWNEAGTSFRFRLEPHFYETTWFGLSLVGLMLTGVLGLYRLRVRQVNLRAEALQRQNEELERRVTDRTAALAERSSELAKSYETLRASEYFYHSLVESLPQIIVRKDVKGVYTYANSAFGELHKRRPEEIVGKTDADIYPAEQAELYRREDLQVMQTHQAMEFENVMEVDGRKRYLHVKKVPLYNELNEPMGVQILFWDMTVFRETEQQLREAQKELIETSRLAGMAEIATGVLHNIGNVLNSVNTSADLATTRARDLRIPSIGRVAQLLVDQGERLGEFFATDPRGQKLPVFLAQLARHLEGERDDLMKEVANIRTSVDHIKDIVAAQQSYARVSGLTEEMPPAQLVELALGISEMSFARHRITVVRDFKPVPVITVQRQKALQILINLLTNAKDSINETEGSDRKIMIGLRESASGLVQITVTDTGHGIAPENVTRIFAFGFTTKKSGHGFGLHSSALAAKEMGGSLSARSPGHGKGATFVLELPRAVANRLKAVRPSGATPFEAVPDDLVAAS